MKPCSTLIIVRFLVTTLLLLLSVHSSDAFEKIIDFETGDASQVTQVNNAAYASIVPSTLPGGGNHAFRCMLPQGVSESYCGFNIALNTMPQTVLTDLYVRYYIKFEPSWLFASDSAYFKSQIVEVTGANYSAGGRSFINFNARNTTTADIALLIYTDGQWHQTGRTISNDNRWHSIESRHLRNLSSPTNGRVQIWIDGELTVDLNPFNAGNANPAYLTFGYRNGSTQQNMYMQYDEVVVADHPIGPINSDGSDRTPPTPPKI